MDGFKVSYVKNGVAVSVFAATERDAKRLISAALHEGDCTGIKVCPKNQ